MPDALKLLSPFSWRAQKYPVLERKVSFRHEGIEHTIQYKDWEAIEQLGAHGLVFSYKLCMRESVAKGPFKNLFTVGLPRLFNDCVNRNPDELVDPVFGPFRCTPNAFEDYTDVLKRCGDDVQVEFKYAPDFNESDPQAKALSLAGLTSEAAALDQEVAKADWKQEPTPEPAIDPLQLANGVISQGLAQIDKFSALLDDYAAKMEALEATCDRAENPQNWPIRASARRLRVAALTLKKRLSENPAQKLASFTVKSASLLSSVALDAGMTLKGLLELNPGLARLPHVPAGTVVVKKQR